MKTITFKVGSLEWLKMKRDLATLRFHRSMEQFNIHDANIACAHEDYYNREIERLELTLFLR